MNTPIRVLLADDHPAFRKGISTTLSTHSDILVAGEAASGEEVLLFCKTQCPDVILLDLKMPGISPFTVVPELKTLCARSQVLVLSAYDDDAYVQGLLKQGIAGYLLKDESPEIVVQAVRAVAQGKRWFSQPIANLIAQAAYPATTRERPTEREMEIIQLLKEGHTDSEIAGALTISERTVRYHIANLFTRLDVNSRIEIVVQAIQKGWVQIS